MAVDALDHPSLARPGTGQAGGVEPGRHLADERDAQRGGGPVDGVAFRHRSDTRRIIDARRRTLARAGTTSWWAPAHRRAPPRPGCRGTRRCRPRSVLASLVSTLQPPPSAASRAQPNGTATRPGRTRSETVAPQHHGAAVVPDPHERALADPSGGGIGGVDLEQRLPLRPAMGRQVPVAGVEEARLALERHARQGVAGAEVGVAVGALARRASRSGADRARPRPGDPTAAPPCRWRSGTCPSANGRQSAGTRRRWRPLVAEALEGDAVHERVVGRVEHARGSSARRCRAAPGRRAHRRRQPAEDLGVGERLAERLDRRLVEREVEVPPRRARGRGARSGWSPASTTSA